MAAHREPVTRAQAARALGLGLPIASFHLERLLRDGFVEVVAGGPEHAGPGRPAKRYRASSAELALAIPPRNYGLAAAIVIEAVRPSWRSVRGRVAHLARGRGREIAGILRRRLGRRPTARSLYAALVRSLGELGYEPRVDRAVVRLTNCPFYALAAVDRAAVCEMNHELLSGVVAGLPECALRASLEPDVGCCVVIRKRRPLVA